MKKLQIIVVLAGLVLIAIFYQLPKTLVSDNVELNDSEHEGTSDHENEHTADNFEEMHPNTNLKIDENKLDGYKKQFYSLKDPKKKIIFADSISALYRAAGQFDSLAYYCSLKADLQADEQSLLAAGDAYFEAFSASGANNKKLNNRARDYYQKVLDSSPDNLDAKAKLAMTYVATETPMKGIMILREILEKDPENESALYNLGILSIQSGQYDKAVERFNDLLKINPDNSNGRFYLGLAYLNMGRTKSAREEFEKAKELDKDPGFQSVVDSYLKELKN